MDLEIKKKQFGVKIIPRGPNDEHVVIQIITEDDENWFDHGNSFSSYWIDDLIDVLQETRRYIQHFTEADIVNGRQYGYKFKKK